MTAPCELDIVVVAHERDEAWEAQKLHEERAEKLARENGQYRRLRFREDPYIVAFGRIGALVNQWRGGRDADGVLEDVAKQIASARKLSEERQKKQEEAA